MANIYKKKNSDKWYYQVVLDGKRYQGSTRTSDKKLAIQIAKSVEADVIRKRFNIPGTEKITVFKDIWKDYLKSLSNSSETVRRKKIASNHFLNEFENSDIKNISITDIKSYQVKRKLEILSLPKNINKREQEISFRSVNIEMSTLSNFFNYCIERELLIKNPCTGIYKLNVLSRIKTLSDDDIEKLINAATNKLTKDIITFLIYTGARIGEALNLKWDDIDFKSEVIQMRGTKTKTDRFIPISDQLKEVIFNIDKNSGYLFSYKDGAKIKSIRTSFKTACRNAGIKDLHIHDLRHVFASKMVMNGTSLYITGELLGHKSMQMTKRYSHLIPDTLKKAVDEAFKKK
jgi:integrase